MKDIKLNGQSYIGIKQVQLPTVQGSVALFEDVDDVKPSGGLTFDTIIDYPREYFLNGGGVFNDQTYGLAEGYSHPFNFKHQYGIVVIDMLGTHDGASSIQGTQTSMLIYSPDSVKGILIGYREKIGLQVVGMTNCVRKQDESEQMIALQGTAGLNTYNSYINKNATGIKRYECEIDKNFCDTLFKTFPAF